VASVPATTLVATTAGAIPGSPAPGAPPDTTVPGNWYGYPSILPVVAAVPGWVQVRLAQRPNQSTTWVPVGDVALSSTPYAIVVDLTTMRLQVYEYGATVLGFPVGVGLPQTPTPTGHYFVTMDAPAPDAGYGLFVVVTSAHSDTITDFAQSGDAIVAIHGPIDAGADALIGSNGATVSNGCIRLHVADLAQLSVIPPGTPVDIVT
jgi:lipoprotein-anchoring transpeptidase ErfK/SrfK